MKFRSKIKLFQKRAGMNLVEIVIAIGVSVITLTTSAVFSTRLILRAQQNFMEDAAVQLTNVVVEQLRLSEVEMQSTKTKYSEGQTTVYPRVFQDQTQWDTFCAQGGSPYLAMDLPVAANPSITSFNYKIQTLPNAANANNVEGKNYRIQDITNQEQTTGAFFLAFPGQNANNKRTGVGILKEIQTSVGQIQIVNLTIVIRYFVLTQTTPQYTRPIEVKMVRETICR